MNSWSTDFFVLSLTSQPVAAVEFLGFGTPSDAELPEPLAIFATPAQATRAVG